MAETPIPQNTEAEEALIGSLLLDTEAIIKVASIITAEDFFNTELSHVYRAVCGLYQDNTPADLITLRNTLNQQKLLGDNDGQVKAVTLFKLMQSTPNPYHIVHYAKEVRRYSLRRRLMGYGARVTQVAFDLDQRADNLLETVGGELQKLIAWEAQQQQTYFRPHEDTLNFLSRYTPTQAEEAIPLIDYPRPTLRFGWKELDGQAPRDVWDSDGVAPSMLLLRSTLTTVLADTSVGKTIVAEQIAEANALAGAHILFFHNELSHDQMEMRRYARLTGIPFYRLVRARENPADSGLNHREMNLIAEAMDYVRTWPGRIDLVHCPGWDGRRVKDETRARHSMLSTTHRGQGYDLVIVDYVQRLGDPSHLMHTNKVERLAANVSALGELANELDIALLATSQVRREGESSKPIKPTLHNALDGGSIERFSNQVLGVWRDGEDAEFIGLKSTFGERDWIKPVVFNPGRFEFQSLEG